MSIQKLRPRKGDEEGVTSPPFAFGVVKANDCEIAPADLYSIIGSDSSEWRVPSIQWEGSAGVTLAEIAEVPDLGVEAPRADPKLDEARCHILQILASSNGRILSGAFYAGLQRLQVAERTARRALATLRSEGITSQRRGGHWWVVRGRRIWQPYKEMRQGCHQGCQMGVYPPERERHEGPQAPPPFHDDARAGGRGPTRCASVGSHARPSDLRVRSRVRCRYRGETLYSMRLPRAASPAGWGADPGRGRAASAVGQGDPASTD